MDNNSDEKKELEIATELRSKIIKNRNDSNIYDTKIYYDGKQYTIRIPAILAKRIKLDVNNDKFRFTFIPVDLESNEKKPSLKGELIKK